MSETKNKGIKRRKFLKYSAVGIGLMVGGVYLTRHSWRRSVLEMAESAVTPYQGDLIPNLWFQITPQNEVILHSTKVEMGQGTFTGLAQLAAEELEVAVGRIKVVHAETATGNIDGMSTGGSLSIASLWQPVREMAATMREMLKGKAAEKLGLAISDLTVENGVVSGGGKSLTYGEIVKDVTEWEFPDTPVLKAKKDFKYVGKPIPRVDLYDKVVGTPMFGMDVEVPDMLHASVVRPDRIDSKLKSCDSAATEKMPGVVKVVKEDDFVGVIAESHIEAENARKALKVEWTINKNWNLEDIIAATKVGMGDLNVIQKEGDAKGVLDGAKESDDFFTMEFATPIGAHAQIEPNGATALVKDGKATVWLSTQVPAVTLNEVSARLGMDKSDVNIIPQYLGGGFGRRLHTPNAIQAAVMSKAVGRPVKSFFDRKQEFQNDTFRPPTHHIMRGKLDANGNIEAMEHSFSSGDVAFNSAIMPGFVRPILGADIGAIRGGTIQYRKIPNIRTEAWHVELPFATSWWRSLGLLANTFAIESFVDELALKAGKNPIDFRLAYIEEGEAGTRLKNVIKTCAEKAGYSDKPVNGRAMGFAASTDAGSPCAHVVEVSIVGNEIKVHKVTTAFDCGIAVNPDQVKAQVEGCIIMGMSASMFEKMDLKDNQLFPTIYGSYQMALMKDAPKEIDITLIEGVDFAGPVGEPPLGPIGAAIGNAVRRLTGKRLTELPFSLG
ncbi:MAG: molybdopterin cofactor-binding domain-containing protein [Chitinophagales bacterium]